MKALQYEIRDVLSLKPLLVDYLAEENKIAPLINRFPGVGAFKDVIHERSFSLESRSILVRTLRSQYSNTKLSAEVQQNIDALLGEDAFTVTTGHQLCLFTGPLYFISKIASTIKLSQLLQQEFPEKKIIPVFWLASEDHDFDEISSVHFPGHDLKWSQSQHGAVGRMNTEGILPVIDQLQELGVHLTTIELLKSAYGHRNLSEATRFLVNELFAQYGLVIIDGDHPDLKSLFCQVMRQEVSLGSSFQAVIRANEFLEKLGYETQVKNPREINLFYLTDKGRNRIVSVGGNQFETADGSRAWTQDELSNEIGEHPQNFSPNVILRPVYQETILPNVAYVGGPGELAYWLQLKGVFDSYHTAMPLLVLRDHVCLLPDNTEQKLSKLGISTRDLFLDKKSLLKLIMPVSDTQLEEEKIRLQEVFESIAKKAAVIDPTLGPAVLADGKRAESVIAQIEGKMMRSLKQREEAKIRQTEKLRDDVFPEGEFQERFFNYFFFASQTNDNLIGDMINAFDPLNNLLTVLFYRTESR